MDLQLKITEVYVLVTVEYVKKKQNVTEEGRVKDLMFFKLFIMLILELYHTMKSSIYVLLIAIS